MPLESQNGGFNYCGVVLWALFRELNSHTTLKNLPFGGIVQGAWFSLVLIIKTMKKKNQNFRSKTL